MVKVFLCLLILKLLLPGLKLLLDLLHLCILVDGLLAHVGQVLLQLGNFGVFACRVTSPLMHLRDELFQLGLLVLNVDIVRLQVLILMLLQDSVHACVHGLHLAVEPVSLLHYGLP